MIQKASSEITHPCLSSLFWAMGRDLKAEILHAGIVGHGKGSGQVGGEPPWPEVVRAAPTIHVGACSHLLTGANHFAIHQGIQRQLDEIRFLHKFHCPTLGYSLVPRFCPVDVAPPNPHSPTDPITINVSTSHVLPQEPGCVAALPSHPGVCSSEITFPVISPLAFVAVTAKGCSGNPTISALYDTGAQTSVLSLLRRVF